MLCTGITYSRPAGGGGGACLGEAAAEQDWEDRPQLEHGVCWHGTRPLSTPCSRAHPGWRHTPCAPSASGAAPSKSIREQSCGSAAARPQRLLQRSRQQPPPQPHRSGYTQAPEAAEVSRHTPSSPQNALPRSPPQDGPPPLERVPLEAVPAAGQWTKGDCKARGSSWAGRLAAGGEPRMALTTGCAHCASPASA